MGLIGTIRSISPVLRVIMGLVMMFVLPWIWMAVFGFIGLSLAPTPSYGYGYGGSGDPLGSFQNAMGVVLIFSLIGYAGYAVIFILGIVMTISGAMDWWKAKQEKN